MAQVMRVLLNFAGVPLFESGMLWKIKNDESECDLIQLKGKMWLEN
jgi:hypothetical protein